MTDIQSKCPASMKTHVFEKTFKIKKAKADKIWERLNLRETFVKGQIFPYKVEFEADEQKGPFKTGELNIHHGPLLSVHGKIGEINDTYRDLQYMYGSYVLSFRFIRPTRLEFFRISETELSLRLTSYVSPFMKPLWNAGNKFFWSFLGITFLF